MNPIEPLLYSLPLLKKIFFIAIGIFGLCFLIGFHELGHFLFCKLFKVSTPSFSIGMGPRLLSKKIGDTVFSFSAIPLGGYVEIAGISEKGQGDQLQASRNDEYSFAQKPYYQKMLILAGGIIFNIIFTIIAFSALYYFGKMPQSPLLYPLHASNEIIYIKPESAADKAQFHEHDTIIKVDGLSTTNALEIIDYYKNKPGQQITFEIIRDNKPMTITTTLDTQEQPEAEALPQGQLGVGFNIPAYSLLTSLRYGTQATWHVTKALFHSLKNIRLGHKSLGGPVMVLSETIKGASRGTNIFLLLLAFISINLAIMNLLPLPILDGGQALYYTIEAIIGRSIPESVREYIHYGTWILLLLALVYLTYQDLLRIFWQ